MRALHLEEYSFMIPFLSRNDSVSCASCHQQEYAFADRNPFSFGINDAITPRTSMPLFNLRYSRRMFWDGRTNTIEAQALLPIQDPHEMDLELDELLVKLDTVEYYPDLFEAAFGRPEITTEGIANAIAQFIRSMYSYQSKYDAGILNDFADFTAEELLGKDLFFSGEFGCNFCHTEATFTSTGFFNTGLNEVYSDQGLGIVTGDPEDNGKFKTPSLRNIEVTAPYMHDARFNTLEEVIEHYNSGVQPHPNLDDRMTTDGEIGGPPKQLNMTEAEKQAIITFLHTLTDEVFLTDEKFSNPFTQ